MKEIDWKALWQRIRKYGLNKYTIVVIISVLLLLFAGDRSLVHQWRICYETAVKEKELRQLREKIDAAKSEINEINASTENLERYAREHYHMRKDNEEVYLIDE